MFPEERNNKGPEPDMIREPKEKKVKQPKPPKVKQPKVKQSKPPKIKEPKTPKVKGPKVKETKRAVLERRNARPLASYLETLTEPERLRVDDFFAEIENRIGLDKYQTLELVEDFERAILYYVGEGLPLETALKRLDPVNLGGFYARPPLLWFPLDDAAKVYPLYMRQGYMAVFRLSVYLRQPVVPELLQMALTFTVKRFPSFATTVKNGFFWHYMDSTKRRYVAEPETDIPCRPLKVGASGSQTFRVLWYQHRISVEFFHILTDATGGMVFLKTLTAEYLRLLGVECGCSRDCGVLDINEGPRHEELENAFGRAEITGRGSGFIEGPAVQMSGTLSSARPCRVLHLEMDSGPLLEAARSRGVTVTAFILSRMMAANRFATEENTGNIQIQVPVDMRKLHDTATLRNFALYGNVKLPIEQIGEPDDMLPEVARQLAEKTSAASMAEMMTATRNLVRYLQFVPLFIKRPAAKAICGYLGDAVYSNTLSNLGAVRLPPELEPHIEKFDFVLGTVSINRAACSMVTCGETAVLCIAKLTADPSFEERLTALLRADKLEVRVKGSELYEY